MTTVLRRANDSFRPPEAASEKGKAAHEIVGGFAVLLEPEPLLPALRWRAVAAVRLEALLRSASPKVNAEGDTDPAPAALRLIEWLAAAGQAAAMQLQFRAEPVTRTLELRLILEVQGRSRDEALRGAQRLLPEFTRVLDEDEGARFAAIGEPLAVAELRTNPGWTEGRVAIAEGWSRRAADLPTLHGAPVRRPRGAAAMRRVAHLLLRQPASCALLVSLRPTEAPGLGTARRLASLHSADVASRAMGQQTWAPQRHTSTTHFPHDLADLHEAAGLLEDQLGWLSELKSNAFSSSVAVVGAAAPGSPLLGAVQHAVVGVRRAEWREVTEDQVRMLARGPREALDMPLGTGPDDGLAANGAAHLHSLVTGLAAARSVEWPCAGEEDIPGLSVEARRARPVPSTLLDAPGVLLGRGRGPTGPVALRLGRDELARHLYVCGRTGVGKSTLLRTLVGDLGRSGDGLCLVDPHGDLSLDVLGDLAGRRKVVVFDPSREDCPGLDPLANDGTLADQERVLEDLTAIIFRIYPAEYMGPMFDRHSRALLIPLICAGEPLSAMARLANDDKFRRRCLLKLDASNPVHTDVATFWKDEYEQWPASLRGEMHSYTVSKYDTLVKSTLLRRVCSRDRKQLDLRGILERGDVLVARLPQGQLGAVSAWFLGMLLLSRLQAEVFARCKTPVAQRTPFTLVVDEFQCFVGQGGFGYNQRSERTLGPLLSEARKYGLRLVLANQFVSQLDESTRQALFGNVGSLVSFRVGWDDAEVLAKNLGGGADPEELRDLPVFRALARLSAAGAPAPLTSLSTINPTGLTAWLRGVGSGG